MTTMTSSVLRRSLFAVVTVLIGGASLVACTGDDSPEPRPSASASADASAPPGGTTDLAKAAEQVTQQYLAGPDSSPAPAAIATVKGTVRADAKDVPGTLDLLAVRAGPRSTEVRWRLSSATTTPGLSTNYYNNIENRLPDTDAVALVAKQANLRSLPGIWSVGSLNDQDCTCAYVPRGLGPAGVEMSNLYPALPANVTEVQLLVPGFPALTAPVTRN
jgi:hypothetical protein